MAEQHHGGVVLLNCLGNETSVFVDRKERQDSNTFDDRVSKGSGSLKISNLAVGTYIVEVKQKDGQSFPGCPGSCKAVFGIKKGQTIKIKADRNGVDLATGPMACGPM